MTDVLIRNARFADGSTGDLSIHGSTIDRAGTSLPANGAEVIDATGLVALPGLVDLHTHLREPGYEQSETVLSGSRAGAAGGFTCVHAMANTSPVADNAGVVDQVASLGRQAGYLEVRPIGAVTLGLNGKRLAEIGTMANSAAAVRVFSDDGKCVSDSLVMRRALEYVKTFGGVIAQHAQDPRLTEGAQMNESELSGELGLAGWPAVAEEAIIARDVLLADHVGARIHICHVSTAGSVDLIRWAKRRGILVTAEVTPHHLLLTEEFARSYNPLFKVNPPLRRESDVVAVREGLADGTIDIVATDHAPHPDESKDCEWVAGANGMLGLETALAVVQKTMVDTGAIGWERLVEVMSAVPAAIGQVGSQGRPLAAGEPANIVLYDDSNPHLVDRREQYSESHNTPYDGMELPGSVVHTFYRGTHTVSDGTVLDVDTGQHE